MILYACMLQFNDVSASASAGAGAGLWDRLLADCRDGVAAAVGASIPDRWLQRAGRLRGPRGAVSLAFGHHGAVRQARMQVQQPDASIAGRRWDTEVGLRQTTPASPVVVTVVLRMHTAGLASLAQGLPQQQVPPLVAHLLRVHPQGVQAPGLRLGVITPEDLAAIDALAVSPLRDAPLVVYGGAVSGRPSLDPERLRCHLQGVADLYVLDASVDRARLRDEQPLLATPPGALTVLHPIPPGLPAVLSEAHANEPEDDTAVGAAFAAAFGAALLSVVPSQTIPAACVDDWLRTPDADPGAALLTELLTPEVIQHVLQHHVTLEDVQLALVTQPPQRPADAAAVAVAPPIRSIEDAIAALAQRDQLLATLREESAEYLQLAHLEEVTTQQLRLRVAELEAQAHDAEARVAQRDAQLDVARAGAALVDLRADVQRFLLGNAHRERMLLHEGLELLAMTYPDRVTVLPSAHASARAQAQVCSVGREALRLMTLLVTAFRDDLIAGVGTVNAHQIFGNEAYAPTESETTSRNGRARKHRTFRHAGRTMIMDAHLKSGNNPTEGWRCHFAWVAEEQRIYIGWCGKHLPLR